VAGIVTRRASRTSAMRRYLVGKIWLFA
jgi:hypothetical protein